MREMTQAEWNAMPKDFRHIMQDGTRAIIEWDDTAGTCLVPVQIRTERQPRKWRGSIYIDPRDMTTADLDHLQYVGDHYCDGTWYRECMVELRNRNRARRTAGASA